MSDKFNVELQHKHSRFGEFSRTSFALILLFFVISRKIKFSSFLRDNSGQHGADKYLIFSIPSICLRRKLYPTSTVVIEVHS